MVARSLRGTVVVVATANVTKAVAIVTITTIVTTLATVVMTIVSTRHNGHSMSYIHTYIHTKTLSHDDVWILKSSI